MLTRTLWNNHQSVLKYIRKSITRRFERIKMANHEVENPTGRELGYDGIEALRGKEIILQTNKEDFWRIKIENIRRPNQTQIGSGIVACIDGEEFPYVFESSQITVLPAEE